MEDRIVFFLPFSIVLTKVKSLNQQLQCITIVNLKILMHFCSNKVIEIHTTTIILTYIQKAKYSFIFKTTMTMNFKKLFFLLGMFIFIASFANAQGAQYIGAAKCKMCHNKADKGEQYNKWLASPHAKAMAALKGDEAKNPKCLKCHSTAASVDQSLVASITVEEGVSCESCHGPGSVYKVATTMKDQKLALTKGMILPEEKVCKKCHNEGSPNYKGFNYKEYAAKIAHKDPTRN